ncbi:MAG: protease [Myxococcales bacterium]|nr:protease [Myxococcales bacterium]
MSSYSTTGRGGSRLSGLWSDLPRLHKMGVYTMIGLAFLALWLGKAFGVGVVGASVVIGALSWFWEPPRFDPARYDTFWTFVTVVVIGIAVYAGFMTELGFVEIGVHFVLYLTLAKLFQRARLLDYAQLLALSFLLIAAATAFNEDVTYGLLFALYVVVGVVTFAVHHLRMEIEANTERGGRRVKQLFGGQYLSVLVAMALLTFLAAVMFFFMFPRLGFGFFAKKTRQGPQQSGFSEEVNLGNHGTIKSDNTVVMRVQFPEGERPPAEQMYWRGISFDEYNGVRWSQTLDQKELLQPDSDWTFHIRHVTDPALAEASTEQQIYLEPIGSNVMFTLDKALSLSLSQKDKNTPAWMRARGITMNTMSDLRFHRKDKVGYLYIVRSYLTPAAPADLRQLGREEVLNLLRNTTHGRDRPRIVDAYLQLPPDLDPRIKELAEEITQDAKTDYDRAASVASYLRNNYTYTTDLPDPGDAQPLSAFLFDFKRGHCEYYATAMVILLRTLGIPARNVNGFYGGQWNEYDAYLAVRNADAHSWVEVPFGIPVGEERAVPYWMRFDPTPPAANVSNMSSWYDPLAKFYDSLRFKWFKYVIEYDLETQLEFLQGIGRSLGASERSMESEELSYRAVDLLIAARRNLVPVFMVLLLSILGGIAVRLREPRPLDKYDAIVVVTVMGTCYGVVALFWKPMASSPAQIYSVALPALMLGGAVIRRIRPDSSRRQLRLQGIVKLYSTLRDLLITHGVPVEPSDGPEQVLALLRASSLPEQDTAEQIIRRYMDVRFGGQQLSGEEEKLLNRALKDLSRALHRAQREAA